MFHKKSHDMSQLFRNGRNINDLPQKLKTIVLFLSKILIKPTKYRPLSVVNSFQLRKRRCPKVNVE